MSSGKLGSCFNCREYHLSVMCSAIHTVRGLDCWLKKKSEVTGKQQHSQYSCCGFNSKPQQVSDTHTLCAWWMEIRGYGCWLKLKEKKGLNSLVSAIYLLQSAAMALISVLVFNRLCNPCTSSACLLQYMVSECIYVLYRLMLHVRYWDAEGISSCQRQ